VGQLDPAVDGDGVVDGGQHRQPQVGQGQQAGAQALVVVHDVEVVATLGQGAAGPEGERQRLREPGGAHERELEGVDPARELPGVRDAEGIRVPVEVEAGQPVEQHPVVELGVGRAAEHLDVVAQVRQGGAQVAGVDALAPAVRLPPVHQERDAQRTVQGHGRTRWPGLDRSVK
jgi:hypothetical protein